MTYLSDKRTRTRKMTIWGTLLVILFLLFFFWSRIASLTQPLFLGVSERLFLGEIFAGNVWDNIATTISAKQDMADTIESLTREKDALSVELAQQKEMLSVADDLSTLSGLHRGVPTLVHTLFSPLSTIYNSFLIDRGFSDGVQVGTIVYTKDNMVIGIVDLVHGNSSRVALLSAPLHELEGVLATSSVSFRVIGYGSGDFVVLAPKNISIELGETIFWKEHSAMPLGKVVRIVNEPQAVSQTVFVEGAYSVTQEQRFYIDAP